MRIRRTLHLTIIRNMRRGLVAALLGAIACLTPLTSPALSKSHPWHKCSGVVRLSFGDTASSIKARDLSCRDARRIIKAPARKLGYHCSNPFAHPKGSGGWITCTKGRHGVHFLYSQS